MKNVFNKIWFHQGFIGFTNSKIDKKTRDKIYDDEKRARTFLPTC